MSVPSDYKVIVQSSREQIDLHRWPLVKKLSEDTETKINMGFDMEWDVTEGEGEKLVALIQIAVHELRTVFLFRVSIRLPLLLSDQFLPEKKVITFQSLARAPQSLFALIQHRPFIKIGRNI